MYLFRVNEGADFSKFETVFEYLKMYFQSPCTIFQSVEKKLVNHYCAYPMLKIKISWNSLNAFNDSMGLGLISRTSRVLTNCAGEGALLAFLKLSGIFKKLLAL